MAKNILDAIGPLSSMSKFCGYSIFSIDHSDFSVRIQHSDVCFQIWIVVINCFLNCYLWDPSQHSALHKSDILSKSLPIILCGSYGFYVFTIIASAAMRKRQSILMKSICDIDEMVRQRMMKELSVEFNLQLEEFGVKFNYLRQKRILIYAILAIVVIDLIVVSQGFAIIRMHSTTASIGYNFITYFWSMQCYSIYFVNFIFMANTVKQRFAKVNECLRSVL